MALLAASSLITLGAAFTAMADAGWEQDGTTWYYMDSKGDKVSDKWMTIGGKQYCFDSDGSMLYGWHMDGDYIYYLGDADDGAMKTGWLCLEYDEDNPPDEGDVSSGSTPGAGTEWFYFQSNGRAVKADDGDEYSAKTINDVKYYFDENGVMLTGWVAVTSAETYDASGISKFKYFGDYSDGAMAKGWKYLTEHPSDSDDSDDLTLTGTEKPSSGEGFWYYFDNSGVPAYLESNASTMSAATTKVNGESYFFDEYGCMHSGLIGLVKEDGTILSGYFGSSDSDGKMHTGKQTAIQEDSGSSYTFYFTASGSNKGAGYTGEKDGYLYYNGKLVKADSGSEYEVFEVNDKFYLVNESGKVQTSNKCYKSDGEYQYEYASGTIYIIDSDKERQGTVSDGGTLPEISFAETYDIM